MSIPTVSWGILSTGAIATKFATGLAASTTGSLVAVASRELSKAQAFAQQFSTQATNITSHGSYDDLLSDPSVDAVYIATPHPHHAYWAIRAAEAGKHILCEKPAAMNAAETMAILEAVHKHDVFFMEAFMYCCHPQTKKLIELVREGAIGRVQLIDAAFSFQSGDNPAGRLQNPDLGGGGILDVGCYPVSAARMVAGVAQGLPFIEPLEFSGSAHMENGVDMGAVACLKFPGGILATLRCGVKVGRETTLKVIGDKGCLWASSPWFCADQGRLVLERTGEEAEEIVTVEGDVPDIYALEADEVAASLAKRESACMSHEDTLGNMRLLDSWRQHIGLTYPSETPEVFSAPIHGRALAVSQPLAMRYGKIVGLEKPVSRLVMGCDNQLDFPHGAVMWDDFFERGGNAFDTAHNYGRGRMEQLLGQWIRSRGVREEVSVIVKGAHTPECFPEALVRQLTTSLERLGTDYTDIYLMHRDNPDVPVGEFVDALNQLHEAGRLRAFGGSNWSIDRLRQANDYAVRHGLKPFRVVSNNFSLARMVDPVWDGCMAASTPAFRDYLAESELGLLSWSSQARGFFTGRAKPDDLSDPMLARCWYSEDNFQRLARAEELAREKGVSPINIALAYVLCQSFATYCLIGPRQLSETRTTFDGLDVILTPQEEAWLDLRRDAK